MNRHFETTGPIALYVEIGKGRVRIIAGDTTDTSVDVEGQDADDVDVSFDSGRLSVVGPKLDGWFGKSRDLDVTVQLPTDSDVAVKTGSADIEVSGQVKDARLKTGSGDVAADTFSGSALLETGSGDVEVSEAHAELNVKSGSGDVSVGTCLGSLQVSTGSGDVEIGTSNARAVVKTGSGDLTIGTARRGKVSAKGASSDVLIGIPAGTPVWADINTVTGSIKSDLDSVGAPQEGQDHIELQARTVSGDILLRRV